MNHKWNSNFPSNDNNFDVNNSDTANILFYKFSEENWCGMGIEPNGTLAVRVGTSNMYKKIFRFQANSEIIDIS